MRFLLLILCSGRPVDVDKPSFFVLRCQKCFRMGYKTGLSLFELKVQVPIKNKYIIKGSMLSEDLLIDTTFESC